MPTPGTRTDGKSAPIESRARAKREHRESKPNRERLNLALIRQKEPQPYKHTAERTKRPQERKYRATERAESESDTASAHHTRHNTDKTAYIEP